MGSGASTSRRYSSRPGRTAACSACEAEAERSRNERLNVRSYNRAEDLSDEEPEPVPEGEEANTPPPRRTSALVVKKVDYMVSSNVKKHNTDDYEICEPRTGDDGEDLPSQLVVRRGETFDVKITFNRPYDCDVDVIKVVFEIGDNPVNSRGTRVPLQVEKGIKPRHWSACCNCVDKDTTVTVLTPPSCLVGKWSLLVETKLKDEDGDVINIKKYKHAYPVYILFNPWCKEDQVYMEDDVMKDEYVLNDHGKIYSGNYRQIGHKPWNFGQFEDDILDCVMYLLDVSMRDSARGNPVSVSRAISAFVNAPDDGGVLVGNWSGDYSDGTAPTKWVGSVGILKEFWKTKKSVQYGQCWVFSGVTTTVSRALGLPARSVTNFASAHDSDGSCTIDYHLDVDGEPMRNRDSDSVWNFHVWNEAWMARPDLAAGYGGWQAYDATPQETSEGIYCAGPSPIRAIKQGEIKMPYDTPFIFAEVNSDKVYWRAQRDGDYEISSINEDAVGKKISTKRPRKADKPEENWRTASYRVRDDPDRMDVTDQYKYPEGSNEERAAVYRAGSNSRRPRTYDQGKRDVRFELEDRDGIMVGNNFELSLKVTNTTREERNVFVQIILSSVYYTGVHKAVIKKEKNTIKLGPIQSEEIPMRVTTDEYLQYVVDQVAFKVRVLAQVEETNQVHNDEDDFRLRRPDLVLEAPKEANVNEPFDVVVKLENTMPLHLTRCSWTVESPKLMKPKEFEEKDLDPHDKAQITVSLTAKKKGLRTVMASFDSKELQDITGEVDIVIVGGDDDC